MAAPIHFITGLPCSGKSTLAHNLASALGGWAVVIGDLVRAARAASPAVAAQTEAAFSASEEYDSAWLASLLRPVLVRGPGPYVIDGAVPMDRVFARLGLGVESVLVVQASNATRRARFLTRRTAGARPDDDDELFAARTRFHLATMARTVHGIAPALRTFDLDGDREPRDLLCQALAAVALAHHRARRPPVRDHSSSGGELASELAALHASALAGGNVQRVAGEAPSTDGEGPLLLFKPGHVLTAALIRQVLDTFERAGYRAGTAAAWGGDAIAASAIVPVHLGLHYQIARYGDISGRVAPSGRPAYDLTRAGCSIAALDAWWHRAPAPVRLAPCVWQKRDKRNDVILNGHVPGLEQRWTHHDAAALAVQLSAGQRALPWETLRLKVLGVSDPKLAHPSSIRHLAFRGRLLTSEPVTLSANLVHLSAGPDEAVRERHLWLTPDDDSGTDPLDSMRGSRLHDAAHLKQLTAWPVRGRVR